MRIAHTTSSLSTHLTRPSCDTVASPRGSSWAMASFSCTAYDPAGFTFLAFLSFLALDLDLATAAALPPRLLRLDTRASFACCLLAETT